MYTHKQAGRSADLKSACLYIAYILTLAYPLLFSIPFFRNVGHFLENIFFVSVAALLLFSQTATTLVLNKNINLPILAGIISLLGYSAAAYSFGDLAEPRFPLLIIFFSIFLLYQHDRSTLNAAGTAKFYFILYALISFFSLFFEENYIDNGDRFKGFALSPTHFSVYILTLLSIVYSSTKSAVFRTSSLLISTYFVALSQTRLSYILLLFILATIFLERHFRYFRRIKGRLILFLTFLFSTILIYPVYHLTSSDLPVSFGRYEDADTSFAGRLAFSRLMIDSILQSDTALQLLLGQGPGAARTLVASEYSEAVFPHNDFLRIMQDFGILGLLLFLTAIAYTATRSTKLLLISTIYIISFYHNMLYSYYLIFIAFFASRTKNAKE